MSHNVPKLCEVLKTHKEKLKKMKKGNEITKKEVDYMLDIILNTFRMTKNIYRIDKTETCYDRNIAKSEEYCEEIRKAFAWYSKPEA